MNFHAHMPHYFTCIVNVFYIPTPQAAYSINYPTLVNCLANSKMTQLNAYQIQELIEPCNAARVQFNP
jgi:hypothetical protein